MSDLSGQLLLIGVNKISENLPWICVCIEALQVHYVSVYAHNYLCCIIIYSVVITNNMNRA